MGTAHHNSVTFTRTASYFGRQNRHSVSCCFSRRRSVQGFAIVNLLLSPQPFLASVRRWNYLGVFDWIGLAYTTEAAFSRANEQTTTVHTSSLQPSRLDYSTPQSFAIAKQSNPPVLRLLYSSGLTSTVYGCSYATHSQSSSTTRAIPQC